MFSPAQNRKDLFSLKPVLAGLLLLLLGAGVFGYYFIPYSVPHSVEQVSEPTAPENKAEVSEQPDAAEPAVVPNNPSENALPDKIRESDTTRPILRTPTTTKLSEPEQIELPVIKLTTPIWGLTMLSSDPIEIKAEVSSPNQKVSKVDFFYSRLGRNGVSMYNTATDVQITNSPLVKISSVTRKPFRLTGIRLESGVYSLYGMVTTKDGIRQISSPTTIFVNEYAPRSDSGAWFPPADSKVAPCIDTSVDWSLPGDFFSPDHPVIQGTKLRFRAVETFGKEKTLKYRWRLSDGRIIAGQGSAAITVDTRGTGGQTIIATVDVKYTNDCQVTASGKAPIVQSANSYLDPEDAFTQEVADDLRPSSGTYVSCPKAGEKLNLVTTLFDIVPGDHLFFEGDDRAIARWSVNVSGDLITKWQDDVIICPGNKKLFLDESNRFLYKLGKTKGGVFSGMPIDLHFTNGGTIEATGGDLVWDLTSVIDTPGDYSAVFESNDGCGTGSLVARTVHITNYCMPCAEGSYDWNSLGSLLGQGAALKIDVTGTQGGASSPGLNFEWTGTDRLFGESGLLHPLARSASTGGNLTLDTKVKITGLNEEGGVLAITADLPYFEEIFESFVFPKNYADGASGEERKTIKAEIAKLQEIYYLQLKYDWALSDRHGKIIARGRDTGPPRIDLTGLNIRYEVVLSVKVTGWEFMTFKVMTPAESLTEYVADQKINYEHSIRCNWSVSVGRILGGQGTHFLMVGDLQPPAGSWVTAFAECAGLKNPGPYYASIAGRPGGEERGGDAPAAILEPPPSGKLMRPAREVANMLPTDSTAIVRPAGNSSADTAASTPVFSVTPTPPATPTPSPDKTAEREFMKVAWPTEPVYVNQAFNVIVTYNRTTEALQIKDNTGEVVSELKSTELNRLIKEKWGPDTEVVAQIRLQSAALYQSETVSCSPDCQSDYFSLASDEQKWTFNVTAHNPGEHKFNLEMRIKPKVEDPGRPPEKVWSKEDLKLAVKAEMPTRLQIFASSGVLGVFGLFFLVRGVNFKVMIAGGDIVGGDKVGGHKVGGDMVGRDKIGGDKIGPGSGP